MSAPARLQHFIDHPKAALDDLFELYDGLEAIATAFLLGDWRGAAFATGHPGEAQLAALAWIGKTFHDVDDVDPIITRGPQGERVVSSIMGKASLRMVEHRGVLTATMIYDKHPILDHFRKIDEDTVLGIMDRKGDAFELFFYLRRLS